MGGQRRCDLETRPPLATGGNLAYRDGMITRLLHTRYRVNDLDKTVRFYKDVLGLQEVRRSQSGRGSELVFLKAPGSE